MPLKLNVGLSKKIVLPDYDSLGASTNLEPETPKNVGMSNKNSHLRRKRKWLFLEAGGIERFWGTRPS